jgi:PPE-repeat protein
MAIDFGALPAEVNSVRIYSGPGSAPMAVAAQAWNTLAAELNAAALAYDKVVTTLASEECQRGVVGACLGGDGRSGHPVCGVDECHRRAGGAGGQSGQGGRDGF